MKDTYDTMSELVESGDRDTWRAAIEDIAEERGYYDSLGQRHAALFAEFGEVLLVSFEEEDSARGRDGHQPLGWSLADPRGWSSLVLLSQGRTWFRDSRVIAYFDRLEDDGFFDGFDRVIFLGAGPCGYAASAYSVAAPGATLIALAPQATLTPARAGWDGRFPEARRLDFTSRYGYAPEMAEAAAQAFVIYDPDQREDAMHAQLFAAAGATPVRARHFGRAPGTLMEQTGALELILDAAGDGTLSETALLRALRVRRTDSTWLSNLLDELEAAGNPHRVARLYRYLLACGRRGPRFRGALELAEAEIDRIEARSPAVPPGTSES
jgi:hypothetical protein